jgi:hypothetical protein
MLTPGFAQAAPIPPVASAFGGLHLKRASDSMDSIVVTSLRRSYAAGDQINVVVSAGLVFSCVLDVETTYQRTIRIVATGTTTLSVAIAALAALTPTGPVGDTTPIVTAALEGGALGTDLLLTTQARQYMSGNYDGEGHTITPANLASFFVSNPLQALAEGDTLCVNYAMVTDTASTGGRRQAIPENANTAIPAGAYFNSRSHPENLVNALPICKVVNGNLVFSTGIEVLAGETNVSLSSVNNLSPLIRNGGFEHGVSGDQTRFGVSDWENRPDLAVNGAWRLGATAVASGAKSLEFNRTSTSAATGRIEQVQELPVTPTQNIKVTVSVRQLIAPIAGTYSIVLNWGDLNSVASGSSTVPLQVLAFVDGAFRAVSQTVAVPANKRFLKSVSVEVAGVTTASTGVALAIDDLQVLVELAAPTVTPVADNTRLLPRVADAIVLEDPSTYSLGQLAALFHFDKSTPATEGQVILERRDQTYPSAPPALAHFGRMYQLGSKLLDTEARALLPRVSADISTVVGVEFTLMWESALQGETVGTYTQAPLRFYASNDGRMLLVSNARFDGTNWNGDVPANPSFRVVIKGDQVRFEYINGAGTWAESGWFPLARVAGVSDIIELINVDLVPSVDGNHFVGTSTKAFFEMWTRAMRIGPGITEDTTRLVHYRSSWNYPTQTDQVDYEYVSAYFGLLTRAGHKFLQDWDTNAAAPSGWTTSSTGGITGSNTLSATQHRTTVAHNGANVGTFTLQTVSSVKFRLTDGFVCRIRCNNAQGADFTKPYVGFYDIGGVGNGITFGPQTVDGGGSHNYQFRVAATNVGGPGDHVFSASQRWLTFALVGTTLWWNVDALTPDGGPSPSDSFSTSGSATITVPTGLYHFVVHADGGGGGFGSSTTIDYVEITTGNRDA